MKYLILPGLAFLLWIMPCSSIFAKDAPEVGDELVTRPIEVIKKVNPRFPANLRNTKYSKGYTMVAFLVDVEGVPKDFVILASTHPTFSKVSINTVKKWKFTPALLYGEPIETRSYVRFNFKQDGWVIIDSSLNGTAAEQEHQYLELYYQVPYMHELDNNIKPVSTVMPDYPADMLLFEESGEALIDFFIDPEGNVLAPSVLRTTNEQTGLAAVAAIKHWKFETPLKDGEPTWARAVQPFAFNFKSPREKLPEGTKKPASDS